MVIIECMNKQRVQRRILQREKYYEREILCEERWETITKYLRVKRNGAVEETEILFYKGIERNKTKKKEGEKERGT